MGGRKTDSRTTQTAVEPHGGVRRGTSHGDGTTSLAVRILGLVLGEPVFKFTTAQRAAIVAKFLECRGKNRRRPESCSAEKPDQA